MPDLMNQPTAAEMKDRLVEAYPSIATLFDKERAKTDKERATAAAAISSIEEDYLPKLEAAAVTKKNAEAESERLRKAHQAAVGVAFQASQQVYSLESTMARLIGQQEKLLRDSADPRIGRLYKQISEMIDTPYGEIAKGAGEPLHVPLPYKLVANAKKEPPAPANQAQCEYDSRVARVETQHAALKQLSDLELQAIDGAELTKMLSAIRAKCLPTNGHSINL